MKETKRLLKKVQFKSLWGIPPKCLILPYVAKRLGHRSVNTTKIYTAPSEEEESEMIERAEIGK